MQRETENTYYENGGLKVVVEAKPCGVIVLGCCDGSYCKRSTKPRSAMDTSEGRDVLQNWGKVVVVVG